MADDEVPTQTMLIEEGQFNAIFEKLCNMGREENFGPIQWALLLGVASRALGKQYGCEIVAKEVSTNIVQGEDHEQKYADQERNKKSPHLEWGKRKKPDPGGGH